MIEVQRRVRAVPEDVFAVLADGWSYAGWVVGASRIRAVEPAFPAPGSRIHHSVGTWPLLIDDHTVVLECAPPTHLVLQAHGWPVGEARIEIDVRAETDGASLVRMREDAVAGPGRFLPRPLRIVAFHPRNAESLRRLAYLAEARTSAGD